MQSAPLHSWAPGHSTTVIDLEERAAGIQNASAPVAASSPAYYALDTSTDGYRSKKRKIERACDFCRKRKTKCDGPKMQGNVCTNCIQNGRSCTYLEGSKPRGPPKAYVTGLEDRVEKMEALLKRLRPEADFTAELGPPVIRDSWKSDSPVVQAVPEQPPAVPSGSMSRNRILSASFLLYPSCPYSTRDHHPPEQALQSPQPHGFKFLPHLPDASQSAAGSAGSPSTGSYESSDSDSSDGEDLEDLALIRGMNDLSMQWLKPRDGPKQVTDSQWRFHGKSSFFKLITPTREFKQQHMDDLARAHSQEPWRPDPEDISRASSNRRQHFWNSLPWEITWEGFGRLSVPDFLSAKFPPMDLAEHLIHVFFHHKNSLFPLLHRPTFERQWLEGLYRSNVWFACLCMSLFGVASRYSDDPRVLSTPPEGHPTDEDELWSWAGWKYIDVAMEVQRQHRSVFLPVDLFEVQTFVLLALYLRGSAAHAESWTHISIGIRKAQDVGAHRRKVYGRKPTVEEELWKRAFWHLVTIDRMGSMLFGRPCASREEDLDLDLPLEVDDEYWENEDPELAFQQPCDKQAQVAAFICWIKLSEVAAFALRTLYALGASKEPLGLVGPGWREEVVAQVNSALSEWVDNIPEHLRWSNNMEDLYFANQAAALYTGYYLLQITVHRPFIPVPRGVTRDSFRRDRRYDSPETGDFPLSALSICVNAAKAGTNILESQAKVQGSVTNTIHFTFVFAGVLLVNLWTQIAKEGARTPQHMYRVYLPLQEDILRLTRILEDLAPRWELAKEACEDLRNSLPTFVPSHDTMTEATSSPEDSGTMSARHGIVDLPFGPEGHSLHGSHRLSNPQSYTMLPSSSGLAPYSAIYNSSAPSLLTSYTEPTQLWTVPDLPPSPPPRFNGPRSYPAHDEWNGEQHVVPLRHPRSTSHLRSTHDHGYDSSYAEAESHTPHMDTGILPSGEILLRDPATMHFHPASSSTRQREPYIKRELPDDGQPMHLFPVEYRQAPSSTPSEYTAPPEILSRQAPASNIQEHPEQWSRSNYRWEQWRVHGYHN